MKRKEVLVLRDKRDGSLVPLRRENPLYWMTDEEIKNPDYLPEWIERVWVVVQDAE